MYGFYPRDSSGASISPMRSAAVLAGAPADPVMPRKSLNAVAFFGVFPVVAYLLLAGGWFGLPQVETRLWGGLLVTLVISSTGIVGSLPLGVLLALGRRSHMPVLRGASIVFIEFCRGVPLITVLFFATYMLPLFLPERLGDRRPRSRAPVGVVLFSAAIWPKWCAAACRLWHAASSRR